MIVLGVDPGTLCTGFGIVRLRHGRLSKIAYGAVKKPGRRRNAPTTIHDLRTAYANP
jgi:Holliday junction resolvasome RuvABC endonuclease subunit